MDYKYKQAILGGTFDHLHAGHKYFIGQALEKSENLTIGLTVDKFSKTKPYESSIQSFGVRKRNLKAYLDRLKSNNRVKIIPIENVYGTTLYNKNIDAIFVTRHGLSNAKIINTKRAEINFPELAISLVRFVRGEDGKIISSTRVRRGEIDSEGNTYFKIFNKTRVLPESLKKKLREPLGEVVKDMSKLRFDNLTIAVGDVISLDLAKVGLQANISIIDFKTRRGPFEQKLKPTISVQNPAGTISCDAVAILQKSFNSNKKEVIRIDGEEDLLTLPAILLAPLRSCVLYGQQGLGIIKVLVTEEKKEEIKKFVSKFKQA